MKNHNELRQSIRIRGTLANMKQSVIVHLDIPAEGRELLVKLGLLRRELADDPAAVGLALLDAADAHVNDKKPELPR